MNAGRSLNDARLRSLLDISKAMAAEIDLDSLLGVILARTIEVTAAERSSFFAYEEETQTLSLWVSDTLARGQVRVPLGAGVAGHVAQTRRSLNVPDAYADPRFNPAADKATSFRTRNILCAPMFSHSGRLLGVLQALNKRGDGAFTDDDVSLLEAFASHAAIAVDRARLIEALVEKQKLEETLRLAHAIQMAMLPKAFPAAPEFELHARLAPARAVGGDLYDFLHDGDRLWFLVADVSGKGVGAALFMAVTKTLFRATVEGKASPSVVLARMNRELSRDNERMMFVTAFLGCLDVRSGTLVFANAGHNLPYRVRGQGAALSVGGESGVALGVIEEVAYPTNTARLERGEGLYIYTDGVTEAMSPAGEAYSPARLEAYLLAAAARPASEVVDGTFAAVAAFEAGQPQSDDITVMWLRYLG